MTGRYTLPITVAAGAVVCLIVSSVVSCGGRDGGTPTAPTSVTSRTVTSVAVRASTTSLEVGATATVMARATYSDGKSAVIIPTWASSAPGVATISAFGPVDNTGTVTAVAGGTTNITGTFGGQSGTVSITVTTLTATVTGVSVSASATSLDVGQTTTVTATAAYSDGTSATVSPTWSSSNPGVATVSSSGAVTAVAAGTATITGTFSGQSGTVSITVTTPTATVTGVSVSASAASLAVGATASVTATATYSDGTSAAVTPTWTSSNTSVATASSSGTVTAVAAGTATITGTFDGQSDSVDITVAGIAPLGTVEVLYNSGTPIAGFQFRVTGVDVTDADGGAAEAAGFSVSTGNNIVLGFSFEGATIPAGNGGLVVLEVAGSGDACLTDLVISDSAGNALGASIEGCLTISVP